MPDDENDLLSKLESIGIQAFFIVTENGFPVIDRVYQPAELGIKGGRVETLTSMMSTVVRFNHQLVEEGLLSDIGLHTSRIYFDFLRGLIFVLMVDESTIVNHHLYNIQTLLKGTISNVKTMFQAKLGEEIEDPDLIDVETLSSIFGDDFLVKVDEELFKSYTELLQHLL